MTKNCNDVILFATNEKFKTKNHTKFRLFQ